MEVAGRDDHVFVREDVRIVGSRIDLALDHRFDIADIVLYGTVYLWDASE